MSKLLQLALIALFTLAACGGPPPPKVAPPAKPCVKPKPPEGIQIRFTGRKVRLVQAMAKEVLGIPLQGDLTVTGELTIPPDAWPTRAVGRLELTCAGCKVPSMPLPVPGNLSKGGINIPTIELGQVSARVTLGNGNLVIDSLASEGDVTLKGEGTVALRKPLGLSRIQAKIQVKVGDKLRSANTVFQLFDAMNRRNKQEDGSYIFEINGTLGRIRTRIQQQKRQREPDLYGRKPARPTSNNPLPQDWATRMIKKVGDGRWTIQRKLLDQLLTDVGIVARAARIVPSVRNGKPNGFKLYAIRPGSIYAVLGLQNGDTITAVNGYDITTPDKALRVYDLVRKANKLVLSLLRRGKELTHTYEIIK